MSFAIFMCVTFTTGYVVEHCYYGYVCMPWYNYFKTLRPSERPSHFFDNMIARSFVAFNCLELVFFIIIINELLKHQNGIWNLVTPNAAVRRVRRNAITAMGHLFSWLLECVVFVICQFLVKSMDDSDITDLGSYEWMFIMLLPSINYLVFPMAQAFTSPELRSHIFSTECCQCQDCTCTDGDPEQEGEGLEHQVAIQLQPLANGNILHI